MMGEKQNKTHVSVCDDGGTRKYAPPSPLQTLFVWDDLILTKKRARNLTSSRLGVHTSVRKIQL